jgi:hypothetical protein
LSSVALTITALMRESLSMVTPSDRGLGRI